jgi:hypothetical protein
MACCRFPSTVLTSKCCARANRVVVAIGEESAGQPIDGMGTALAKGLGSKPVPFPGDHMGFGPQADSFAEALHRVFSGQ